MSTPSISTNQRAVLLHRLGFLQNKVVDQALKKAVGIGLSQFKVLYSLQEHLECSQCQIARSLDLTEAAVSRQIALLESGEYVLASTQGINLRAKTLLLTAKGLKTVEQSWAVLDELDEAIWDGVSSEDQRTVRRALETAVANLQKMCECE